MPDYREDFLNLLLVASWKNFKMNIECTRRSFSNVYSASIQVPVVQGSCFFEHKNNKQNGNEQGNDHLATATRCCNRISGY